MPGRARSSFPVWHALTRADQPRSARCPVRQSDTARRVATSWRVRTCPGFVVTEVKGHWGDAEPVKESASLTGQRYTFITLVSCPSSGNCGAAGYYGAKTMRALVVDERNGVWGAAQEIPHWPWLDAGGYVSIYALSCASAGNCAAGGLYVDGTAARKQEAFVVDETDGTWNRAEEVPNTARLNSFGLGATTSVSCPPNGGCTAALVLRR